MATRFVATETTQLLKDTGPKKAVLTELLWGDRVSLPGDTVAGGFVKARARGRTGFVRAADLGDESLLELYFIDVGQGDGVLVRTPDGRHVLVDGGFTRAKQPSGKNAADFVDWKFVKDYGQSGITLDAVIASHNDADHYGGLWDLISRDAEARAELDAKSVDVKAFYHAGVSWWTLEGKRSLGRRRSGCLVDLIDDRPSIFAALGTAANPRLQGEWRQFLQAVADLECPVRRLGHRTAFLPGFEPAAGRAAIRVLGPVERTVAGRPALPYLEGSDSKTTNGHSAVLRIDYGRARIVLTGDLNATSQRLLLEQHAGEPDVFACDVVKSCHHGSDDCSLAFLKAVAAGATVISSGDAENHAHPRPAIVAASALTGHQQVQGDRLVTPLVYSTELSRSHRLGKVIDLEGPGIAADATLARYEAEYRETAAGAVTPRRGHRSLEGSYLLAGMVYGLVNVRTDGRRILCATMNESGAGWQIRSFDARF